jgi:DNA-binding NarL/FixJ family response regulator
MNSNDRGIDPLGRARGIKPMVLQHTLHRTVSAGQVFRGHVFLGEANGKRQWLGWPGGHSLQNALLLQPGLKSIVLTFDATAKEAEQCMKAGAFGCVARVICPFELVGMVRAATYQEQTISIPSCSIPLVAVASTLLEVLSAREFQVLQYIAVGADNLKISAHLEISERTVKAHVHAIYQKLGFENRTQLALFALKRGIPPVEEV